MKQKINYTGDSEVISEAVQKANEILENVEFHKELSEKDSFDESNASGTIISKLIKSSKVKASVEIYKPKWLWSKANAYTRPINPNLIYLNNRKIKKRDEIEWTATLIHEYIHLVDFESKEYYFAHGSNDRRDKDNTAPYWIDNLVFKILKK